MNRSLSMMWQRTNRALALIVGMSLASPALAVPRPTGFPVAVALPSGLLPIYIVGDELEIIGDTERLVARTFDMVQEVEDGRSVEHHFVDLFSRLGWSGTFAPSAEAREAIFSKDEVSVKVRIEPGTREDSLVSLQVRVEEAS
jgi:hypothetical protein